MTKIDKSLDGLYPYFKSLILKLEKKLVDAHIPIFPFETLLVGIVPSKTVINAFPTV